MWAKIAAQAPSPTASESPEPKMASEVKATSVAPSISSSSSFSSSSIAPSISAKTTPTTIASSNSSSAKPLNVPIAPAKRVVVVDSGPLIKNAQLASLDAEIYTVPEVLHEIRDEDARRRISLLPFEIKTREPVEKAIDFVKYFASKTGDLRVLSEVDIRVIALTLMFEKERVGVSHLRKEPAPPQEQVSTDPETKEETEEEGEHSKDDAEDASQAEGAEKLPGWGAGEEEDEQEEQEEQEVEEEQEGKDEQVNENQSIPSDEAQKAASDTQSLSGDSKSSKKSSKPKDDGEGVWITPDNVQQFKLRDGPTQFGDGSQFKVSCMTTDYAMQNVLMQIGMKVLSFDGMQIKSMRRYILLCHACHKTTQEMGKMFCPSCGNHTLIRVSMVTNESGEVDYVGGPRHVNLRGSKYSIPNPKGGRKSQNLVLREDQKEATKYRPKQKSQADIFDPDYAFGSSKRGNGSGVQYGYGKKNPNVVRKNTGNRK